MEHRDIILEITDLPHDDQEGLYHGETRENGPCHKIGRVNGTVPTRNHRGGKVKGYRGVHREHKGRGQPGQDQGHFFKALPVFGAAAPSKTEDAVYFLLKFVSGTVA